MVNYLFSSRLQNCINWNSNIETVNDLLYFRKKDLLNITNFGLKCLKEITFIMHEFGYKDFPKTK